MSPSITSTKFRRVALLGFTATGKTSLANQFVGQEFEDAYDPTIVNSFEKKINVRGDEFNLELMDGAGQDENARIPQSHLMNTDGYILVYSITSPRSFEVAKRVHKELTQTVGSAKLALVLVGNKTDLEEERTISVEQGKTLAADMNAAFVETSAKTNNHVNEIFTAIVTEVEIATGNFTPSKSGCTLA